MRLHEGIWPIRNEAGGLTTRVTKLIEYRYQVSTSSVGWNSFLPEAIERVTSLKHESGYCRLHLLNIFFRQSIRDEAHDEGYFDCTKPRLRRSIFVLLIEAARGDRKGYFVSYDSFSISSSGRPNTPRDHVIVLHC